jgi:hypothetical protein
VIARPGGRDLEGHELERYVAALAARPELWGHLVSHDPGARVYEELLRDDHLAVWLICWMHDHDTGFHDHDLSSGAVAVASGAVHEDRLRLDGSARRRIFGPGRAFSFGAADIHRVVHAGDAPAVTLHAYSPPLWRMGAYEIRSDGTLARHSLSYAEELRPLEAVRAA